QDPTARKPVPCTRPPTAGPAGSAEPPAPPPPKARHTAPGQTASEPYRRRMRGPSWRPATQRKQLADEEPAQPERRRGTGRVRACLRSLQPARTRSLEPDDAASVLSSRRLQGHCPLN